MIENIDLEVRNASDRYTECYIAFLDILGFKNMVEQEDYSGIREYLV